MSTLSVKFHDCIDRANCLTIPTGQIAKYLDAHPTVYKITLLMNHLFRASMMVGLMFIPHVPLYASMTLCFAGSLFYRMTVERNCAYKFALPAFAGAAAFMLALPAFIHLIHGAFSLQAAVSFIPLTLYGAYIILTTSYDVDKMLGRLPSQREEEKCCCTALRREDQRESN